MKNFFSKLINFFYAIAPPQGQYSWFERLRVSLGVGVTILVMALMNHLWGDMTQEENMVTAVFGVSALCIFFRVFSSFSPKPKKNLGIVRIPMRTSVLGKRDT